MLWKSCYLEHFPEPGNDLELLHAFAIKLKPEISTETPSFHLWLILSKLQSVMNSVLLSHRLLWLNANRQQIFHLQIIRLNQVINFVDKLITNMIIFIANFLMALGVKGIHIVVLFVLSFIVRLNCMVKLDHLHHIISNS